MTPRSTAKPKARSDLLEHFGFIARDNVDAAERFLLAAEETFQQLARRPTIGRVRAFDHPRLVGLRSWPVRGFKRHLIFYRPTESGIEVIRVLHGARDLPTIFDDESR